MEPGLHWSLTSPFFCLSWIVFLMHKAGPIDVTLDGLSVSLRTVPHSKSHGQFFKTLEVFDKVLPNRNCGGMQRPQGTDLQSTAEWPNTDCTAITLQALHLWISFASILRSVRVVAILTPISHWGLPFTPDLKPARLGVDSLMDLAMPLFRRVIAAASKAEGNKET